MKANLAKRDMSIVLAGGSTPKIVYQCWNQIPFRDFICWNTLQFYWGDERCVPPDHPESNFKMAQEAFLEPLKIPSHQIHRIRGEDPPDKEALRYGNIAEKLFMEGRDPGFDWTLLGIGTDGHTASIFPPSLSDSNPKTPCIVATHPETGQKRISLTLETLNRSKRVSFLATGKSKAEIVKQVIESSKAEIYYPAARIQSANGILEWYLDEDAACLLGSAY